MSCWDVSVSIAVTCKDSEELDKHLHEMVTEIRKRFNGAGYELSDSTIRRTQSVVISSR